MKILNWRKNAEKYKPSVGLYPGYVEGGEGGRKIAENKCRWNSQVHLHFQSRIMVYLLMLLFSLMYTSLFIKSVVIKFISLREKNIKIQYLKNWKLINSIEN